MKDKLLKKYINKVKTHVFGLDSALTQLFNFYNYSLMGEDWVVSCEECGQRQISLVTTNGKEFVLELKQEGLFYNLNNGGTSFPIKAKAIFPVLEEIERCLTK